MIMAIPPVSSPLAPAQALVLSADPDFVDMALDEFRRDASESELLAELAPGVWLVASAGGFWTLAERWQEQPPIFVRHIHPVDVAVPLTGETEADLAALAQAVAQEIAPWMDEELPFSVQTRILAQLPYRPYDVNQRLAEELQRHSPAPLDVRRPGQILSVTCAAMPREVAQRLPGPGGAVLALPDETTDPVPVALLGLSTAHHNLSDWAGGVRRFAREPDQVSRSEFKLLEALETFGVSPPPGGHALDLGASPGGWTRVLRERGLYVTAVDPGALDPRLEGDRGIRHLRMTAEEYLAQDPDVFHVIVNDMRMDARDSARLMVRFAPYLAPDGFAIMTLKLPRQNRRRVLEHALSILEEAYRVERVRQLFHNRSEVTVLLRPKGAGEAGARPLGDHARGRT